MRDPYFYSDTESASPFFFSPVPTDPLLTPKRIVGHVVLLVLTCITTTIAGAVFPYLLQDIDNIGFSQLYHILTATYTPLINGLLFSFTFLIILGTHEMGHYIACRYYGIQATLPYFLPAPIGVGTFGAFIRIKSSIPTRRALFDVGIAGPLCGFIFAVPATFAGIYYGKALGVTGDLPITLNHPLLFTLISKLIGAPTEIAWNPIWFACWVGMMATALNLLPVGQLDGGHVVYALFGKLGHRIIAITITISQICTTYFAFTRYGYSGGFLYVILLPIMLFLRHPQVNDEREPIGWVRKIFGVIALLVFILSFMPIPWKMN